MSIKHINGDPSIQPLDQSSGNHQKTTAESAIQTLISRQRAQTLTYSPSQASLAIKEVSILNDSALPAITSLAEGKQPTSANQDILGRIRSATFTGTRCSIENRTEKFSPNKALFPDQEKLFADLTSKLSLPMLNEIDSIEISKSLVTRYNCAKGDQEKSKIIFILKQFHILGQADITLDQAQSNKTQLEQTEKWIKNYNAILVQIASYSPGQEMIRKYIEIFQGTDKEHVSELIQQLCETHEEKKSLFNFVKMITNHDLQDQNYQSLFRNTTLTTLVCSYYLTKELHLQLTDTAEKLAKHSKAHLDLSKPSSEFTKIAEGFFNKLYKINITRNIKELVKVRVEAVKAKFSSTLENTADAGLVDLLFLHGINPFFNNHEKLQDKAPLVGKLTKILQAMANQSRFISQSNDAALLNPIYDRFIAKHNEFVAKISN